MIYIIELENNKIGTSYLEKADAPMGVVFGKINFGSKPLDYNFFSKYCKDNKIVAQDYADDKLIVTQTIPKLKVFNENGIEVKGLGCSIEGMDSEGYEINIIGIPYPFYEEEFPHHVKEYHNKFK